MGRHERLERHFDHRTEEPRLFEEWEAGGHFRPRHREGSPSFTLPMPPPNITGHLHMGHAYFATLQDAMIRHRRMRGDAALWLPGTDHAGLATHARIMEELRSDGISDPTPAQYAATASRWRDATGGRITAQLRRLGASCDWSRERYTLDARYGTAVKEAFLRLDDMGLIERRDGQWWLDTSGMARDLLARMDRGELRIIPAHEEKTLRNFLGHNEPWCLSRQIPWGHPIPAWISPDGRGCADRGQADAEGRLGKDCRPDGDVFDTWFSSALWPFASLGWPERTDDLRRHYPASAIETGADILFFWCARMLMLGIALTGEMPFRTIYLHGMIRDERGDKLSKTLGNGIDPLGLIDRWGCDGLRMAMLENTTPGQDLLLGDDAFESGRRLANKLWQASRFALGHYGRDGYPRDAVISHPDDLGILEECRTAAGEISEAFDAWDFRRAAGVLRRFLKDRFCDVHIERAKDRLREGDPGARRALLDALDRLLRMAHPFMPYLSERIRSSYSSRLLISDTIEPEDTA